MKYRKQLMTYNITSRLRSAIAGCKELTLLCAALALDGCGKPAPRPPEKALVSTAAVQPMDDLRSDGQTSYLAQVKFDHETDLSFKVGGILVSVGPTVGTDWDEGTPVKAGAVLAELKQAD